MGKIDKHYISEIDKKLAQFDAIHSKSAAQRAESEKYQRIYQLRDNIAEAPLIKKDIWE